MLCSQLQRYRKVLLPVAYGVYYQNIPCIHWEKSDNCLCFALRLLLPRAISPTFKHLVGTPEMVFNHFRLPYPSLMFVGSHRGNHSWGCPSRSMNTFFRFSGRCILYLFLPAAHLCLTTFRTELIPATRLSSVVLCPQYKLFPTCSSSWSKTWGPFQTGVHVL